MPVYTEHSLPPPFWIGPLDERVIRAWIRCLLPRAARNDAVVPATGRLRI